MAVHVERQEEGDGRERERERERGVVRKEHSARVRFVILFNFSDSLCLRLLIS